MVELALVNMVLMNDVQFLELPYLETWLCKVAAG
jgi:hypothetical protein